MGAHACVRACIQSSAAAHAVCPRARTQVPAARGAGAQQPLPARPCHEPIRAGSARGRAGHQPEGNRRGHQLPQERCVRCVVCGWPTGLRASPWGSGGGGACVVRSTRQALCSLHRSPSPAPPLPARHCQCGPATAIGALPPFAGESFWSRLTVTPVFDEAGCTVSHINVLSDITELVQRRVRAARARAGSMQHWAHPLCAKQAST